jgi:tetratricopeptide (TPR) repeat protein
MEADDSKQLGEAMKQAKYQLLGLLVTLSLSLLVIFSCGATVAGRLYAGWIAIGWGLAFFFPAFTVGMLFGIPKQNEDAAETKKASSLAMNGNFAQISDWMTKMITGVTLVNAKNIPSYIDRAGTYVGASLTSSGDVGPSLGGAIAILFSGLGFVAGFIFTSVYLSLALHATVNTLNDVVRRLSSGERESLVPPDVPKPPGVRAPQANTAAQETAVAKLKDLQVDPSASAEALQLLGNAKMNVGRFEEAQEAFTYAIEKSPKVYRLRQSLATALFRQKKVSEAVKAMESGIPLLDGETRNHILAFYETLTEYCLRLPSPANYQKCMQYAQQFLSKYTDDYGGIAIDYAGAYGLKASDKLRNDPQANIDEEAKEARKWVDRTLAASYDWREDIETFLNPRANENYLAVFKDHPAFANLFEATPS